MVGVQTRLLKCFGQSHGVVHIGECPQLNGKSHVLELSGR